MPRSWRPLDRLKAGRLAATGNLEIAMAIKKIAWRRGAAGRAALHVLPAARPLRSETGASMNVQIFTTSAGTGETSTLVEILEGALLGRPDTPPCRPEAILATTFTRSAAAELRERVRVRLLSQGHQEAAQEIQAARIGTIHSVCGQLVRDFAMDLGLSSYIWVLDEPEAKAALSRALTTRSAAEHQSEMVRLGFTLKELTGDENSHLHWEQGVRAILETARASGLSSDQLPESAARSVKSLLALLGPAHADGAALDASLRAALRSFVAAVDPEQHTKKNTAEFLAQAQAALNKLERGHALAWADWASLAHKKPQKELWPLAEPLREAAAAHDHHPRL